MKTTVEIATPVLKAAKRLAAQEGTTLRELVEQGLRRVLEEHEHHAEFVLRDSSFAGSGLQPEFRGAAWDEIRDAAYRERGG